MGTAVDDLMQQADLPLALPVLSALYRDWINPGHELTVLDAMTLMTAIAGHIGSELSTGAPHIPPDVAQRILSADTLAALLDADPGATAHRHAWTPCCAVTARCCRA